MIVCNFCQGQHDFMRCPDVADPIDWARLEDMSDAALSIFDEWRRRMRGTGEPFTPVLPDDESSFADCYHLIRRFPQMRVGLESLAQSDPQWSALLVAWPELSGLYERGRDGEDDYVTTELERVLYGDEEDEEDSNEDEDD